MTKREKELNNAVRNLLTAMRGLTVDEGLRLLKTIENRITCTATISEDTKLDELIVYEGEELPLYNIP